VYNSQRKFVNLKDNDHLDIVRRYEIDHLDVIIVVIVDLELHEIIFLLDRNLIDLRSLLITLQFIFLLFEIVLCLASNTPTLIRMTPL